jgi:peptidoglycan/LPS O-acetylase OafA/YrhL
MQQSKTFIAEFEPIRGLAALTVVLMHSFYVLDPENSGSFARFAIPAMKFVCNGFAAVTIFFLLSGVVLGMALDRYEGTLTAKWRQFLILRAFRIYPMVWVVTGCICLFLLLLPPPIAPHEAATDWFNRNYQEPLSWYRAAQNALLINVSLNPVAWTLMVELAMALIFPLMHLVARRRSKLVDASVLVVLVTLAVFAYDLRALAPDNLVYVLFCELVLLHAYKFYLGLILATYASRALLLPLLSKPAVYFALALIVVISARQVLPSLGVHVQLAILAESLAAAALLMPFCRQERLIDARLLAQPGVRWLGKVSYSFYVWHFFVLYALTHALLASVPTEWIESHALAFSCALAVTTIFVTSVLSHLSFDLVEARYMTLGRQVARALAARGPVTART